MITIESLQIKKKIFRTLKYNLNLLNQAKNFSINPKNKNTFVDVIYKNNGWYFFNNEVNTNFTIIAELLYNYEFVSNYISKKSIISELKNIIDFKTRDIELIKKLVIGLNKNLKMTKHYVVVRGIKFHGNRILKIGKHKIVHFSKIKKDIQKLSSKNDIKYMNSELNNEYLIVGEYFGEIEKTVEKFELDCNDTINILRLFLFMISLNVHSRKVEINLLHNSKTKIGEQFIISNEKNLTYSWDFKPPPLEITKDIYEAYNQNIFKPLNLIFQKNEVSKTEQIIKNFVFWIGEARNELNDENSFLKYCIALENLFTIKTISINEYFYKGIIGTVYASPVEYEHKDFDFYDYRSMTTVIKDFYDKRSRIVHNGLRGIIDLSDLDLMAYISFKILMHLVNYKELDFHVIVNNSIECYDLMNDRINKKVPKCFYHPPN